HDRTSLRPSLVIAIQLLSVSQQRIGLITYSCFYQTLRLSRPNAWRFPSMVWRRKIAAFSGSGSTAKLAPTTSLRPSVSILTTFIDPVIGGIGPRWVVTPEATK